MTSPKPESDVGVESPPDRLYVVDVATLPWVPGGTQGVTFRGQVLLSGDDGGPEAFRFRFDPCPAVHAHLHLVSQFQLLIDGEMDLPRAGASLRPIGVFYTDHSRPYGPFAVRGSHEVLVLHPRKGGLVSMADLGARRRIHTGGRERIGNEAQSEWRPVGLSATARAKVLIDIPNGPTTVLLELPPGRTFAPQAARYGRYEVVVRGSMIFDGSEVGHPGLRYVQGGSPPPPAESGPRGATLALMTFDTDAIEGGVTGDDFAVAADEAMARAI
jgi:hypothetical protein